MDERRPGILKVKAGRTCVAVRARGGRVNPRASERGTVLIVTMWIVLVLAGLVLVLARSIRVEAIASANYLASLQAASVARGAVEFALSRVDTAAGAVPSETDLPSEAVQVGDGLFWLLRTNFDDDRTYSFGMSDEASKINLNSATLEMLLKLPGMTAELAAAIMDWRDADSEVTPGGAENEYYLLLPEPHYCKNAPFETVEELLLVKGASQEILYGEDTNRNGLLDPNEDDASDSEPADNNDGHLDRGIFDYVTVYSVEPNVSSTGETRVNVNSSDTQPLSALLRDVMSQDRLFQVIDRVRRNRPFQNILGFYFRSGLTMDEFKQIADRLTTSGGGDLAGLVNVNTAPRQVLLCLPGLDENDVAALLAKRTAEGTDLSSIAWVAEALPLDKAVAVGGHITTHSFQLACDVVALSGNGRAYKRCRCVIDARQSPARIVYWKNLSHLGWPLAPEIVSTLRAGGSLL